MNTLGRDKGQWIIGLGLLALIGLLLWIGLSISEIGYRVSKEQATSDAYRDAYREFQDKCTVKTTLEEIIACFGDAINTAREPGRSEEDVDAQKQMASAAWAMLKATLAIGVLSIALTLIGIFYIRQTLSETSRTADAAAAANANTLKAIDQEQANAQRELRAYVYVSEAVIIRRPSDNIMAVIAFKNFGQTPAKSTTFGIEDIGLYSSDESEVSFGDGPIHVHDEIDDIAPGHERIMRTRTKRFRPADWDRLMRNEIAVYVWGEVKYKDVFGADQVMSFRRVAKSVPSDELITQGEVYAIPEDGFTNLTLCRKGNKST